MKSGVWGMQLRCGQHRDIIPFFVRPQVGKPQAKVCYLAATFTYQVYGNFSRGVYDDAFRHRVAEWKAAANNPDAQDYGLATYNYHRDGSGVAYSSHLRPCCRGGPTISRSTIRWARACAICRPTAISPAGQTGWAWPTMSSPTTTCTEPRASRS
jgi:hypothetical protein